MSTRSRIGIDRGQDNIESIYCHWDGYLSHNGQLLLDHWTDRMAVRALVERGDLSSLGREIGQKHNFDAGYATGTVTNPTWCKFYGRDRGETGCESVLHKLDEWPDSGQEYEYLLTLDSQWLYRSVSYREVGPVDRTGHAPYVAVWSDWEPLTPSAITAEGMDTGSLYEPLETA